MERGARGRIENGNEALGVGWWAVSEGFLEERKRFASEGEGF